MKGIEYLRNKLNSKSPRVKERYKQYEMKKDDHRQGIVIPNQLKYLYKANLGWCCKAVDCVADRLVFRQFANDNFGMQEIFNLNNPDIFFDNAILSALIASCCFIYISKDKGERVRLEVIEADNATGIIDASTGLLTEGYAVLKRDDQNKAIIEAYFLPRKTIIIENGITKIFRNNVDYPLLVPIIHRPDAVRPFGRSRISRSAEYWQKSAKETLERADVTAEFYSFPQKYIMGLDSDTEKLDTWKATISSMLVVEKGKDGNNPVVGQFSSGNMQPFIDQFRMNAAGFAGETGLTLDDLGFVSDNPSSAEAIKASHESLGVMTRKAQRCFASAFINVGMLAVCLRDDYTYYRDNFYLTKVKWEPIFTSDASTLSLIGDGVIKINQAVDGYIDKETIRDLTGIKGADE